jgi:signal transduction histidine kinase
VEDAHAQLARELGVCSLIAVPLSSRGQILGSLTLASSDPLRRYGDMEAELARRAVLAIDNARLYERSQEAIRLRDEFLSVASHELNTPTTTTLLTLQAILHHLQMSKPMDPERMRELLERGERQAKRLSRLIGALLDIARIDVGLVLQRSEVDLGELVREVLKGMDPELVRAHCRVVTNDGELRGLWDRSRLEQVLLNLLSNAAKFGAGRPIEVTWGQAGELALLTVKDQGCTARRACVARLADRTEPLAFRLRRILRNRSRQMRWLFGLVSGRPEPP